MSNTLICTLAPDANKDDDMVRDLTLMFVLGLVTYFNSVTANGVVLVY